jgi:ABC-type uncharacterized transport system involved in gliding motility auxiliary subunit
MVRNKIQRHAWHNLHRLAKYSIDRLGMYSTKNGLNNFHNYAKSTFAFLRYYMLAYSIAVLIKIIDITTLSKH